MVIEQVAHFYIDIIFNISVKIMGFIFSPVHIFTYNFPRYLEMCLTKGSGVRKADGRTVISRIAMNSVGRDLAFDFVRDKWDTVVEK